MKIPSQPTPLSKLVFPRVHDVVFHGLSGYCAFFFSGSGGQRYPRIFERFFEDLLGEADHVQLCLQLSVSELR